MIVMEPEELAAAVLLVLPAVSQNGMVALPNVTSALMGNAGQEGIPMSQRAGVEQALIEAWAWLEAQGLLVPAPGMNGSNGWRKLSRRAAKITDKRTFEQFSATRYLRKEHLHRAIADSVWAAFLRGEYDVAVFQSMKAVEVAVRTTAKLPNSDVGVHLVRKAFHPDNGPLTDKEAQTGEREAMMNLFAGALGLYKNPQSHRDVGLTSPVEAMEVVLLANHLLRVVDSRVR